MSDMPTDLVDRLALSDVERVYLPTTATGKRPNAATEAHASNPAVAAIAQEYFDSPDRLHGDVAPQVTILREQPIHRMMIWQHAAGASAPDIAKQTGFSTSQVTQILRQPWARARLVQFLKESGQDKVKHFLNGEVAPSLEVLREIRDDPLAKRTEKMTASIALLDRALGKPTVHVESDSTHHNVPTDLARLDAEIASLRKQVDGIVPTAN